MPQGQSVRNAECQKLCLPFAAGILFNVVPIKTQAARHATFAFA
jgi:hypothetical protein